MDPIKSYAQNFEDVMLWRALGHVEKGQYVDVGAQSPLVDSVSMAFYQHGWRGVHVEPSAAYAQQLRSARPDELVVQAAVGEGHGTVTFFELPGTGLSTLDASIARSHVEQGFLVNESVTPIVSLDDVLAQIDGDVHWLKVDVEGAEEHVLRSWKDDGVLPWVVVIESTLPLSQLTSYEAWEPILLGKGYRFAYFDGLNRFYVSKDHLELVEAFEVGPNCFDGFALSGTATSSFSGVLLGELSDARRKVESLEEGLRDAKIELDSFKEIAAKDEAAFKSERQNLLEKIDWMSERFSRSSQEEQLLHHASELDQSIKWFQSHASDLQRHIDDLQQHLAELQRHAGGLEERALRAEGLLAQDAEQMQWWQRHAAAVERKVDWLEHHRSQAEAEALELSQRLEAIHCSTSWRIMAPLRFAALFVRKFPGLVRNDPPGTKVRAKIWMKPRLLAAADYVAQRRSLKALANVAMTPFPSISRRLSRMRRPQAEEIAHAPAQLQPDPVSFRSRVVSSRLRIDMGPRHKMEGDR